MSLRNQVKQMFSGNCDCGPVVTNEVLEGRYFEVTPRPRGLVIDVYERSFFAKKDWEKRYGAGTKLLGQFLSLTNRVMDAETAKRFNGITNSFGLDALPNWSYQSVGVDVRVQEVDESYPELDQDAAESRRRFEKITKILKPYRHVHLEGGANVSEPLRSETNARSPGL